MNRHLIGVVLFGFLLVASPAVCGEAAETGTERGRFGFAFHDRSESDAFRLGICLVLPGGPADTAGLRLGDIVTTVDGRSDFRDALAVLSYVFGLKPGHVLELGVSRGEERATVAIAAARATPEEMAAMDEILRRERLRRDLERRSETGQETGLEAEK